MMKAVVVRTMQLFEAQGDQVKQELQQFDPKLRALVEIAVNAICETAIEIQNGRLDLRATRCFRIVCSSDEFEDKQVYHKYIYSSLPPKFGAFCV